MTAFQKLNNAEIMQLKTYFTDFDLLNQRLKESKSLPSFIEYLKKLKTEAETTKKAPYEIYRLPLPDSN